MPTITIDGHLLEVPSGITVLRAAEMHGIAIPKLCDFEHLTPYGGCRLCVVEVQGSRMLQTSCTIPVTEGMEVLTDTPRVRRARRLVLGMLFGERNHFCMFCQVSGGDCDLQNAALAEEMTHWPMQPPWEPYLVDASHPYFVLDNNRCILCRRCVRACDELVGNRTWGMASRGAETILSADNGLPWGESSCIKCGTCVEVCPTGALIERHSAYQGLSAQTEAVPGLCAGCSVGCGLTLRVRGNRLVCIQSRWEAPANRGLLCEEGRLRPFYEARQRLDTPLVRRNGALQAATWKEAWERIAGELRASAKKTAALISTRLPAENLAAFARLFREGLRASMVACLEEGYPTHPALERGLTPERRATLEDLRSADGVLLIGADLVNRHPVAGFFLKRNLPEKTRLILCAPSDNPLSGQARVRLEASGAAILSTLRALSKGVRTANPSGDEAVSKAAGILKSSRAPLIVIGRGFTGEADEASVAALLELAGNCGAKILLLYGKANSRAALAYGLQTRFSPEGMQAAFVLLGDDRPGNSLARRLREVPFVAVQAAWHSELTAQAEVVLPAPLWTEQGGHYLNLEGRLQEARAALSPPEGIHTTLETLQRLALLLGVPLSLEWRAGLGNWVNG